MASGVTRMKQRTVGRAALALLAASIVSLSQVAVASASGGNAANARLCQKGGWQTLYNSTTGAAFSGEGACVSYGATGGEYSSLRWTASVSGGFVTMTLYGFGLEPGSEWSYRGSYSSGGFGFGVAGIGFTPADGTVSGPSVSAG